MKWLLVPALAATLAACTQKTVRDIDAVVDANFDTGEVKVTCRKSNTGICHGLFLTAGVSDDGEVAVGRTASISGLGPDTYYCLDVKKPVFPECRARRLMEGEQIVRSSTVVAR